MVAAWPRSRSRVTERYSTITLNRPDVLNALNKAMHDGIYAGARAGAGSLRARRRDHRRGPRLLRRPGPAGVLERRRDRRRQPARELPPHRAGDPGAREARDRRRERPCRRRRHVARVRLRRAHRKRCRELRPRVREHRPRSGLGRLVARAPRARRRARVRVACDRAPPACRRGARVGRRLRGRARRRARSAHEGGRGALRRDADPRGLGDEAPARRGRDVDLRGAARARGDDAGRADPDLRLPRRASLPSSRSARLPSPALRSCRRTRSISSSPTTSSAGG